MNNKELLKRFALPESELERAVNEAMAGLVAPQVDELYDNSVHDFAPNALISGTILRIVADDVMVDIGYKSEGVVPLFEFEDSGPPVSGQRIEVLMEGTDEATGLLLLSKRRAERMRGWERIVSSHGEGAIIKGAATRKIKGGLLLDVAGVNVFLPASQIDIRRVPDVGLYIGRDLECKIIKIDRERMNIVVSRRKLLEERRTAMREQLLSTLQEGQIVKGTVKNIADFGAFLDIGGVDGLLHITDMSWGRVNHPSELVQLEQELTVKVLRYDKERNRIALGLKQLEPSPWAEVEKKYPIGSKVKGEVVNIMPYGAFVKLEDGVEGLVHISEMSWTRNVRHPSKLVSIGESIEAVVLKVDETEEKVSLGMKQTEQDPWMALPQKYPVGTRLRGKVRNLTSFGAFVEIEPGIDGLIHISDMSWTKRVQHPSEVVKKGDEVDVLILNVDAENKRISLGLKQAQEDPWLRIGETYPVGTELRGRVMRLMDKGVVVDLGNDIEGFVPMSQLGIPDIQQPGDAVKEGQAAELKVLEVDPIHHRIVLAATGFPKDDIIPVPHPEPVIDDETPKVDA